MKLYIKQTMFSARPHFLVKDENQNDKYPNARLQRGKISRKNA